MLLRFGFCLPDLLLVKGDEKGDVVAGGDGEDGHYYRWIWVATIVVGHGEEDLAATVTAFMVITLLELIEDHEDEIGPSSPYI
ncbi:hypothetical protein ACLOJK_029669 [Asimina triloba]